MGAKNTPSGKRTLSQGSEGPAPGPRPAAGATKLFPVAALGASAGGLEALVELFHAMKADSGAAFVVVTHLDPDNKSALVDILAKATAMPVVEARDSLPVAPNHVYVMPPNAEMAIAGGRLHLAPRFEARQPPMPIDTFFCALATDRKERAIGVVLSGTGSDGTRGVKAIKREGGITIAQDESAKYKGMPRGAVQADCADFVLPPAKIAAELLRLGRELVAGGGHADLARRRNDMPLPVGRFFQDPGLFDALKRLVFPALLRDRPASAPVRVWVPGCATGEEVYSLAMALVEFMEEMSCATPLKLFGTDLNGGFLATARAGFYLENGIADVSPQRRRRFFDKSDGGYRVRKAVRDLCVFGLQDVVADPPFPRLDLISCRRVLSSLSIFLQQRVLADFRYALQTTGFLVLDLFEGISAYVDFFEVVDKAHGIYARAAHAGRLDGDRHGTSLARAGTGALEDGFLGTQDVHREADRVVLARYAPYGVIVDEHFQIVQFRGQTGHCLEPAPGKPTRDLFQMARAGLLAELRDVLEQAARDNLPARRAGIRVETSELAKDIAVQVLPITAPGSARRYFVVLFEEPAQPRPGEENAVTRAAQLVPGAGPEREITNLKQELAATREYLQSIIEQREAAIEELKAANEEIVSSNEELQSTNEELETAQEELQASIEELSTVNDELQNRMRTASQLSDDLANLIDSVHLPTIVVGHDLRLRRFSPSANRVLTLIGTDVGRHIGNFQLKINVNLETLIQEVLDTLSVKQLEVTDHAGRWFQVVIRPYKTSANQIDGAVVTFMDIDALKRRERQIKEAHDYAVHIVDTVREPLVILNGDLRVRSANPAFYETFKTTPAQTVNHDIFAVADRQWDIPPLHALLEDLLPKQNKIENYQVEYTFPALGHRVLQLNARRVAHREGGGRNRIS